MQLPKTVRHYNGTRLEDFYWDGNKAIQRSSERRGRCTVVPWGVLALSAQAPTRLRFITMLANV
jgi:hypothetical protein